MKWTVMAFNIITIILLAVIIYFQYNELTYYRSFDQAAIQAEIDAKKALEAANKPAPAGVAETTDSAIATPAETQADASTAETTESTEDSDDSDF